MPLISAVALLGTPALRPPRLSPGLLPLIGYLLLLYAVPGIVPLSAALLLASLLRQDAGSAQRVLPSQEGVVFPSRYNCAAFYRGPSRSPAHVTAGPARRGRWRSFLFAFTKARSGRKVRGELPCRG
jgi:hypothetical protein